MAQIYAYFIKVHNILQELIVNIVIKRAYVYFLLVELGLGKLKVLNMSTLVVLKTKKIKF